MTCCLLLLLLCCCFSLLLHVSISCFWERDPACSSSSSSSRAIPEKGKRANLYSKKARVCVFVYDDDDETTTRTTDERREEASSYFT